MADPKPPPWTPDWEIPTAAGPAPHPASNWRRRFVVGACIALAGHIPASGLWLLTLFTFTFFATPDSLFLMTFLIALLQLVLFTGCVVFGCLQLINGDRGLGLGLLAGWGAGIIGAVLGTLLIFVIAEFAS